MDLEVIQDVGFVRRQLEADRPQRALGATWRNGSKVLVPWLIAAVKLILAAGGTGTPLDYGDLERWTRIGFERGMAFQHREPGFAPILLKLQILGTPLGYPTSSSRSLPPWASTYGPGADECLEVPSEHRFERLPFRL
jgi:hypothetical protein